MHISRSMRSYMIIFFPLSNTLILSKIADFSVLNHVVASGVLRTNVVNYIVLKIDDLSENE